MPLVKQHNTWAQAAGKGLSSVGNGPTSSSNSEMENDQDNTGGSASKVMRMEENVNESQIAAALSEGWGQRGINQDTAWEVPSSPHLSPTKEAPPPNSTYGSGSSTGTEIWENSVRKQHLPPSATPHPKGVPNQPPWGGHTPTTHIGGTWGEEEDTTNMWMGVPASPPPPPSHHQPHHPTYQGGDKVWGAEGGKGSWEQQQQASNLQGMNANWANEPPPALQVGLPHMPLANENKNIGEDSGMDSQPPWADPSHKPNRAMGNWSPAGPKKMHPSGWDETQPPPVPGQANYDDGTAGWGNPVHQGKVSHWKEMPPPKQNMPPGNMCNPGGMIRLPNKNDPTWMNKGQQMGRNWNDPAGQHRRIWDDEKGGAPNTPNSAFGNFGEQGHPMGQYWPSKSKNANSWADGQVDTSSWGGPMKQGGKPLTKDLIWASKQFRLLLEMNFKKDDIENALRRSNMNLEEALMELHALNNKENSMLDIEGLTAMNLNQPRVHLGNVADDMNFADHSMDTSLPPGNMYGNNAFPGMNMFSTGFNVAQNCKNQNSVGNNIAPNILGNAGTNNQVPNFNMSNGINNLSPAMMRKLLSQTQAFNPACIPPQSTGRMTQQNFPSTAQLRILVQQIQMAVQAGHLNPTILNQPLAPQTLQLLYQLLQQIRYLHQIQQQQIYYQHGNNKRGSPPLQLSVTITQTKQHIVNLQNQIAAQQAIFLKQQVQLPVQQHPSLQNPQPSTFDVVKTNLETINGLHSEFRDLSVKEPPPPSSRLQQWKLSSYDKDDAPPTDPDFSRAPGPKPPHENAWPPQEQPPAPWSNSEDPAAVQDSGSESEKHNSASSDKDSPPSASYNLNDLVPEFEPGKPWKGTSRIKNFEDDPHVTPGSIAKSPLSLNSIKDSDLFTWNAKQQTSASLTSSTWTFSPPPSSQNSDSSSGRSGNSRSWNNRPSEPDRMSWKGGPTPPMPKTSRPPPGMGGQNKPITSNWEGGQQVWSSNAGWDKQPGNSNFLILKNLTPQIDGSTLKTLCLQHGPLQLFHLLLPHGLALVRYSSQQETEKARSALNNCVLSNTTILVDIPTEAEVKACLAWAGGDNTPPYSSSSSGTNSYPTNTSTPSTNGGSPSSKLGTANWNNSSSSGLSSTLWSFSGGAGGGNGVWGTPTEHIDPPIPPSSLNSYLPGDLLGGGEPI